MPRPAFARANQVGGIFCCTPSQQPVAEAVPISGPPEGRMRGVKSGSVDSELAPPKPCRIARAYLSRFPACRFFFFSPFFSHRERLACMGFDYRGPGNRPPRNHGSHRTPSYTCSCRHGPEAADMGTPRAGRSPVWLSRHQHSINGRVTAPPGPIPLVGYVGRPPGPCGHNVRFPPTVWKGPSISP